jgi:hypothetical protein
MRKGEKYEEDEKFNMVEVLCTQNEYIIFKLVEKGAKVERRKREKINHFRL